MACVTKIYPITSVEILEKFLEEKKIENAKIQLT